MTTLTGIRTGLATAIGTISGLRTSATIPDQVNPPLAVIGPPRVTYDTAMHRGLDQYEVIVTVLVNRDSERVAQGLLDGYAAPTGSTSIKTAIEADRSLGGACSTLRVTEMRGVSPVAIGDTTYLTAEFVVSVFG